MADHDSLTRILARNITRLEQETEQKRAERDALLWHEAALEREAIILKEINKKLKERERNLEEEVKLIDAKNEELRKECDPLLKQFGNEIWR